MARSVGSKRILITGTRADYEPVFRAVEAQEPLQYVLRTFAETPEPTIYRSGLYIPTLGVSARGDCTRDHAYYLMMASEEVRTKPYPQRSGVTLHDLSEYCAPVSLVLSPGGLFDGEYQRRTGPVYARCFILGELATNATDAAILRVFERFRREFRKRFIKVDTWWLGSEAAELCRSGLRFTQTVQAPAGADLRWDQRT